MRTSSKRLFALLLSLSLIAGGGQIAYGGVIDNVNNSALELRVGEYANTKESKTVFGMLWNIISRIDSLDTKLDQVFQSASNGKAAVAGVLTSNGVSTEDNATFETIKDNIQTMATNKYEAGKIAGGAGKMKVASGVCTIDGVATSNLPSNSSLLVNTGLTGITPQYVFVYMPQPFGPTWNWGYYYQLQWGRVLTSQSIMYDKVDLCLNSMYATNILAYYSNNANPHVYIGLRVRYNNGQIYLDSTTADYAISIQALMNPIQVYWYVFY